ncbi:MAG: hypothetical protein WCO61_06990 [Alphaproteobacteria bacterium]
MNSLFGLQLPQPYLYVLALAGILALLALFAFILRRVVQTSRGVDGSGRGRQPRLGIVDTFSVDRQRQLMIVRRDSVEHLILVGGNSDVVIETNIVRSNAAGQRETPNLAKLPPQAVSVSSTTPELPSVQSPLPKVPLAPVAPITATSRPAFSTRGEDTDIRPSDFAEIARHFERPADLRGVDLPLTAEHTLPPVSQDPFGQQFGRQAPLTATHDPYTPQLKDGDDEEMRAENDPLSAPIIPIRDELTPTEGLRRLLGRNRDTP